MVEVVLHGPSFSPINPKVTPEAIADAVNLGLDTKAEAAQVASEAAATHAIVAGAQQDVQSLKASLATVTASLTTVQTTLTATQARVTVLETATPPPATPNAVATFSLGATTNTTQVLNWTAPAGGAALTFYDSRYKLAGSATWSAGPSVAVGTLTTTVTGLTSGGTYDYGVVTRNAAGPGGASATLTKATTTSFTPSPAWTEITDGVGTIIMNDGGQVTIVGGVMKLNGSNMGVSALVNLALINTAGVVYQRNIYNDFWYWSPPANPPWIFTQDPRAAPPPSGTTAPPQAVSAGFTTLTLPTDFDNTNEATGYDSGAVAWWWPGTTEGRLINDNQFHISGGILTVDVGGSYATAMTTAHDTSSVKSTPSSKVTTPNTHGVIYYLGYFEAVMRCDGTTGGDTGNWWPSFWATARHDQAGDQLELDFVEINPRPANGFWNWFASDGSGQGPYGQAFVAGGADGYPGYDFTSSYNASGLDLSGGWNVYGCLWTTTRVTFYWNSEARRLQGIADTVVGTYPTTTPIHGQTNNGAIGDYTLRGATNGNGLIVMLSGSSGKNVQFKYVKVWQ